MTSRPTTQNGQTYEWCVIVTLDKPYHYYFGGDDWKATQECAKYFRKYLDSHVVVVDYDGEDIVVDYDGEAVTA